MHNGELERWEPREGDSGDIESSGSSELSRIISFVFLGLAILYMLSPVDVVPDVIPVAGWLDDILIMASASLNAIHKNIAVTNETLNKILKVLNMACFGLVVLGIVFMGLFTLLIYKVFFA